MSLGLGLRSELVSGLGFGPALGLGIRVGARVGVNARVQISHTNYSQWPLGIPAPRTFMPAVYHPADHRRGQPAEPDHYRRGAASPGRRPPPLGRVGRDAAKGFPHVPANPIPNPTP